MGNATEAAIVVANYLLVPGLAYGCQLALGALGVTLTFAILRFSNFAHGEVMSAGAMMAIFSVWALQSAGIGLGLLPTALLALPIAAAGTALLLLVIDRGVYRHFRRRKADPVILLILSIGVMFILAGLIRFLIGPEDLSFGDGARFLISAVEFRQRFGTAEGLTIRTSQAITLVATLAACAALFLFLGKTTTGKMMRAYSDNEDLALLSGIDPDRIVRLAWIITACLATLAGVLYGLDKSYKPLVYQQLLLPVFAAAIVGGLGNPLGALVGGFVVAFSEVLLTYAYVGVGKYLAPGSVAEVGLLQFLPTDYKFAVSFVILVLILLVRPQGIFGGKPA